MLESLTFQYFAKEKYNGDTEDPIFFLYMWASLLLSSENKKVLLNCLFELLEKTKNEESELNWLRFPNKTILIQFREIWTSWLNAKLTIPEAQAMRMEYLLKYWKT